MNKMLFFSLLLLACIVNAMAQLPQTPNPILFITQTPVAGFTSVTQTFSNHNPQVDNAPRGGDLMLRYPDGTLRNLTREAGFGDTAEMQGAKAIAVRQPCVHWSGNKAVFSMVIGAPVKKWDVSPQYWQLYEVTGLGKGEKAVIRKVPHQPEQYNNISPVYGSDDAIIFTSDIPVGKEAHLYPQLDEYESAQVVSGLWSLNTQSGELKMLQHSPSGSFYPIVDSYGRVLFSRWDHLQRDQQADADRAERLAGKTPTYGTFTWSDESKNATPTEVDAEVFPEPRAKNSPDYTAEFSLHTFNQFFPWEINQDGSEEETINHVGRHEFGGTYTEGSYPSDKNLNYVIPRSSIKNKVFLRGDGGMFHLRESPTNPGVYYCTNAREFARESAGQILRFTAPRVMNPEEMEIEEITHPVTAFSTEDGKTPDPRHSGHYRNPLPLSDGRLIVSHSTSTYANKNLGSGNTRAVLYNFRLKSMKQVTLDGKSYYEADELLTNGIVRTTSYYNGNDYIITRTDTLWELDAVEVRPLPIPEMTSHPSLPLVEQQVFAEEGVNATQLRNWMQERNLALIISRNVTTRDRNDNTQPFNLRVPEGGVESIGKPGTIYDVQYMQLFQGDMLRGMGGTKSPRAGRRVLAKEMHLRDSLNPPAVTAPAGGVRIAKDGSVASFVPAARAMTWQLTDIQGKGIVRERYWVTFQPGEIRTCTSCHGINSKDQTGGDIPQNKPEALRQLLRYWKSNNGITTGIEQPATASNTAGIILEQNSPNPCATSTIIEYSLPTPAKVVLTVYNLQGKEVAIVVNEAQEAGKHSIRWNTAPFAKGEYVYRLQVGEAVLSRRLQIVR